jgi:ATP-binding cassette, subfamily B, bacterial
VVFTVGLAVGQRISIGSVALMLTLSAQINLQLVILVFNLTWLERTHRAVRRLVWLEDYAEQAHARVHIGTLAPVPEQLHVGIKLDGVSFTYPGTEKPVLEPLDLLLPAGQTVAIVGENGAGKTTLVKLLCRFYEPTGGRIMVDGIDLNSFAVDEWRSRLTAGFQDFAQLRLLARESVGVGQTGQLESEKWILDALERASAGAVLEALPQGLATQLGRQFDGVDLSTGQWQKVALGRTMMRTDPLLMILDEPTASLDASTEHALFEHFAQAAQTYSAKCGTITILVSHRFSTVRMADLILVVAGGRIAELGSHQELIRAKGTYAELYGLQAGAYR